MNLPACRIHVVRGAALLTALLWVLCVPPTGRAATSPPAEIRFVASIHPLAAILAEVTAGRATVEQLLAPGVSPHTFEPTPADMKRLDRARGFFFAGPGLDGEWVGRLPARHKIAMLDLVPREYLLPMTEHHHHGDEGEDGPHHHDEEDAHHGAITDPHFWTDPLAVKAMLPALVRELSTLDPGGAAAYAANAQAMAERLDRLDAELRRTLAPVAGRAALLFHPSFNYLFHRYRLKPAGVVETAPGREPTPKSLLTLVTRVRQERIKAIFTEPQLARRPAEVLAEAAGVRVYELDPLGGSAGRQTYDELLRFNAAVLAEALR